MKINRITPEEHPFLQIVSNIVKKPELLYWIGDLPQQRQLVVAIIGTRRPTLYGTKVTFELAYSLAKRGVTILSGLAYGIDSTAHKAALEAGGRTMAIMPAGLDTIYPVGHRQLAHSIVASGGALITEYDTGTPVMKHHFLERNRLVSGLADAVIVTEAGKRSGTLSTVTHALEQGKEVFVVPGNITSEQSYGPNSLLKQGAHAVTSVDDILAVLAPELLTKSVPLTGSTPEQTTILQLIHSGISDTTVLQQHSGLSTAHFMQTLTMLEIEQRIFPMKTGGWALKGTGFTNQS